jgi:hypothetical protein
MRNGGSPPAHLSLSSLSDYSGWLQYEWLQPPPLAPEWVINSYLKFDPSANVGRSLRNEEWLQQALCKDQQVASLLPPKLPGGPILLGARARAERYYQDWKWTVNALWEDERHRLQMAARQRHFDKQAACKQQEAAYCQCLLDKRAVNKCQEANCCQPLLNEQAANNCQEAARPQRLLDKETACHQCLLDAHTAVARWTAATTTIFLRLCRCCLQIRLSRKTARLQQCEAALARLQYKQECCARAAMADKRQRQAMATREKVLANEADEQRCQEEAACTAMLAEMALAKEQCRHKVAEHATALVTEVLAEEQFAKSW